MYNYHVVIVHFPIALLTLYSVLEIIRFRRVMAISSFSHIKGFLVILGFASAVVARETGEQIAEQFFGNQQLQELVQTHSLFAFLSTLLFFILALIYIASWWQKLGRLSGIAARIREHWIMAIAGVIGLALITITGALGGAIAFGPSVDPVSEAVYKLFF